MNIEDYIQMYNLLARSMGWNLIERSFGPQEKGKIYVPFKIKTPPFLIQ